VANNFETRILDEFTAIVGGAAANISSLSSTSAGTGGGAFSLSSVFKSGFGLSPLIGGIISLFNGGDSEQPAPLVKYQLPAALDIRRAKAGSGTYELDYDQAGNARTISGSVSNSSQVTGQQVTVNIQAMDARSFLDRSNDIAAAVRDAMLNLSSLNDVIADL
jgi:hypothetical protein